MKYIFLSIIISITTSVFAQTEFKKGYFISNAGSKTNCLIEDLDWKNNPEKFRYRLDSTGEIKTATIEEVQEFTIGRNTVFERYITKIEKSSQVTSTLSEEKQPQFTIDTVFLQKILEAELSLFIYEDDISRKYFFSFDSIIAEPLIYKKYMATTYTEEGFSDRTFVNENTLFKNQLWSLISKTDCKTIDDTRVFSTSYTRQSLLNLFTEINDCIGSPTTILADNKKKGDINLSLKFGGKLSDFTIVRVNTADIDSFDPSLSIQFGIELEYVLPFNNGKWSIFTDPTYQYYKASTTEAATSLSGNAALNIDFQSIEIPLGIRYNLYINDNNKVFLNAGYNIESTFESSVINYEGSRELGIIPSWTFFGGAGVKTRDFLSLEIRYQSDSNLLSNYNFLRSEYSTISFVLGIQVF